jgi:lysophospholipase L1-like esterase
LVGFGVLFVFAVPFYIEFFLRRPVGEGPAGPSVDTAAFKSGTAWTQDPIMLVGIGDSVTRGLGAKNASHSFFNRLHTNPDDEFDDMQGKCLSAVFPNLQRINLSVSGSTSLDHERLVSEELSNALEPLLDPETKGIVVMTTGGNDLIHSYGRRAPKEGAMYGATLDQAIPWIEKFEQRIAAMFDSIDNQFKAGCQIFVGDIYDPTDGVGDAPSIFLPPWPDGLAIHARYNQSIRRVADERDFVHVVPLHQTFLGHGSHCRQFWRANYDSSDPSYWFYSNIEDPNDRGYDAIRRVFLNEIVAQRMKW